MVLHRFSGKQSSYCSERKIQKIITMKHLKSINESVKFTFKTEKPTGKWKSFDSDSHYIKMGGKEIGSIDPDKPHKVSFMVIKDDINSDGNPNCVWKRITFKREFETVEAAKKWLTENAERLTSTYNFYKLEQ
jgi:hypothetical protein